MSIVLHICVSICRVLLVQLLQMQENNKLVTRGVQFKLLYSPKTKFHLQQHSAVFKGKHNLTDLFPQCCS